MYHLFFAGESKDFLIVIAIITTVNYEFFLFEGFLHIRSIVSDHFELCNLENVELIIKGRFDSFCIVIGVLIPSRLTQIVEAARQQKNEQCNPNRLKSSVPSSYLE